MPISVAEVTDRHMPVGAEPVPNSSGTRFRVWAQNHQAIEVVFEDNRPPFPLTPEGNGYFSGQAPDAEPGTLYKFRVDGDGPFPDPASRYQPNGPHHFSAVVDPAAFEWTDAAWPGVSLDGQVVYEMHIGTFTKAGTWTAAAEKLDYLRDTGVTLLEVMPVSDFPGKFGWGYDGVQAFAPASVYGTPDDMRRFVDQAHSVGLGVILDVVYNHVGPDGNYLRHFSEAYFSEKHMTDWGQGLNFDGDLCGPVREFFRENAAYWIREFHLDGLRLDATQDIHDESQPHIMSEISQAAHQAAGKRSIVLIGENEPQETKLIRPIALGGYGLDALWNDDFHHSAMVALTAKADAYYTDYRGTAQEFVSAIKYGYLYQGQWYRWQGQRRGFPAFGIPRPSMVTFIQNHDQVANSGRGQRAHELTSPGKYKAMSALMLLAPGTPMLFQGQEFAASTPFLFFADHEPGLAKMVRDGRIEFLKQWRSLKLPEMTSCVADPADSATFERCKLDFDDVKRHAPLYALHRDLLRLRRQDPVLSKQGADGLDGAVLSDSCFLIRYFSPQHDRDRLLLVNLGTDLQLNPAPEPLLAPPPEMEWEKLWSTDDPEYGGCGTPPLDTEQNWQIPGEAAVLLHPVPCGPKPKLKKQKR